MKIGLLKGLFAVRKAIGTFSNVVVHIIRVFYTQCTITPTLIAWSLKKNRYIQLITKIELDHIIHQIHIGK